LRAYGALAYDATRAKVVLFGGAGVAGDTWDWTGAGWAALPTGAGPSARSAPAAAYDEARHLFVLFGGSGGGTELGDTWELLRYAGGCTADTDCETGICAAGVCCLSACASCQTCGTGTCVPVTNKKDPSCNGTCDAAGRCLKSDGAACTTRDECASTFCVDGVCCGSSCSEPCYACRAALTQSLDGTCAPATAQTDPHDDCPDQGACGCQLDGQCDGRGGCEVYQPPTDCACGNARRALFGYQCDGFGTCKAPQSAASACETPTSLAFADGTAKSCAPYKCTSAPSPQCMTECTTSDDCAAPATCNAEHTCDAPPASPSSGPPSCSAARAPGPAPRGLLVLAALAIAAGVRRRRSP
jgi:MYXO-CTERM domain-containing protein